MYSLPFASGTFDTVTMDRVLASADKPAAAIAEAARTLRSGGRLCIVEDFDALAASGKTNPLAMLREWLSAVQLHCVRLHPIDTDAGHLIIVIARPTRAIQQAA
jgi:ArsR family transcriptional regulator